MKPAAAVLAVLIVGVCSTQAASHKLYVYAVAENGRVSVEAYFQDKKRAINADVRVYGPDGELLQSGKTDGHGLFEFVPAKKTDLTIRVDAGQGHMAEYKVASDELVVPDTPSSANGSGFSEAKIMRLEREIRELREQINFRDIAGGIGYIFGIAGVAMYFLSKRQNRKKRDNGTG